MNLFDLISYRQNFIKNFEIQSAKILYNIIILHCQNDFPISTVSNEIKKIPLWFPEIKKMDEVESKIFDLDLIELQLNFIDRLEMVIKNSHTYFTNHNHTWKNLTYRNFLSEDMNLKDIQNLKNQ